MNKLFSLSLIVFAVSAFAAPETPAPAKSAPTIELNGSLQLQAQKAFWDNGTKNNLDDFFGRANLGAFFKTGNFQANINIRAFPEGFGYEPIIGAAFDSSIMALEVQKTKIAKFQIEQAWFKYIWGNTSLQFGRFDRSLAKTPNLGNYVDQEQSGGFMAKGYYHHATELTMNTGKLSSSILLGAGDAKLNTGYLRIYECISPIQGMNLGAAYRSNVFDIAYDENATVLNRFSFVADYQVIKDLTPYVEFGIIQKATKEKYDMPVLVGCKIPTASFFSTLAFELEFLSDRKIGGEDVPVLWNLYFDKKVGERTRFQSGIFADPQGSKASDIRFAIRMSSFLK
jgi:hypothetical protein